MGVREAWTMGEKRKGDDGAKTRVTGGLGWWVGVFDATTATNVGVRDILRNQLRLRLTRGPNDV